METSFLGASTSEAHTDDVDPLVWNDRARRAAARAPLGEDANMCVVPPEPGPKKLLPRARSGRDPFPPAPKEAATSDGDPSG